MENNKDKTVGRRPKRKKGGCLKWAVIIVGALFLLGFCGAMLGDSGGESDTEETTEEVAEQTKETEEDVSEAEAEELEEDSDSIDENIMFLDSGVALYTDTRGIIFGEKSHLETFSGKHVSTLKDNHKDFKNGVIFRNVMPLQDKYGNQEDTNVIAVYYSPETIEEINFDNWPTLDSRGLYQTADNVFIHSVLLNEASEFRGYGHTEGAPIDFYDYVGTTD